MALFTTTCITNCLVCAYSENPTDFPIGSVSFVNLVLANATSHTQTRCTQAENETHLLLFFNFHLNFL